MAELHIIDILQNVVSNIRKSINILNIVDNNDNTYTLTLENVNYLYLYDYIQLIGCGNLSGENILISNINSTDKKITINLTSGLIISTFGQIKKNSPYFAFGKNIEVANYLSLLEKSDTFKLQKFPLIYVVLDIQENRNTLVSNEINNLRVYFIAESQQNYTNEQRLLIFKNTLIPIYQDFLTEIKNNFYFNLENNKEINHDYIERYFLGSNDKSQNVLNEVCEAIEINITNLKYKLSVFKC